LKNLQSYQPNFHKKPKRPTLHTPRKKTKTKLPERPNQKDSLQKNERYFKYLASNLIEMKKTWHFVDLEEPDGVCLKYNSFGPRWADKK
jgi:hypothetical protein